MNAEDQIETLAATVQRMVEESGRPEHFNARVWLDDWLTRKVPALGFRRPADVLMEPGGLKRIQQILAGMQSGAYF
ncbi:MAG: hypothetical protein C0453_04455 [Comamonadaceae bacterium]|nr:hypothetical protein [Comamonadaceae bacterium]